MRGRPDGRAAQTRAQQLLVTATGAATLGAEIATARLVAPYFGASTVVWANTIAVVLGSLSVGYWFGGRLADRFPDDRALRVTALIAAGALSLVPLLGEPLLAVIVDALDRFGAAASAGSLVGVVALAAPPMLLLGAVPPWAIRLALRSVDDAGRTAGRLYALSTLGSLAGVLLAALVLVPFAGTQRTFIGFAAVLAGVAAHRLPRRAWLIPAAVVALLALPPGGVEPAPGAVARPPAHGDDASSASPAVV